MFYGIITQQATGYTEHQLRAYPLASQRVQDGAKAVPARTVRRFAQRLRTPHVTTIHAGGIKVTYLTAAEAAELLRTVN